MKHITEVQSLESGGIKSGRNARVAVPANSSICPSHMDISRLERPPSPNWLLQLCIRLKIKQRAKYETDETQILSARGISSFLGVHR